MKKILAFLLALTMLLSLSACGGSDEPAVKEKVPAAKTPTEAPTEPPYVGTTYTTDLGYVSITTMEGWDKGTPNSNYALTIVPTDSKFGWVDIKDLQLSSLEDDIEYISVGYPGTTWTEMTIGSNTFQYMKTLTGTVCYLVAETSTGKAFDIEVRGVAMEDVLPMLESIVIH